MDVKKAEDSQRPSNYFRDREKPNKRGRIIIRNLSFQVNEEKLKAFFKDYGDIQDVAILRLDNGRSKGVGFAQFKDKQSAVKAIHECNMKQFCGRQIAVDLAVPKERYKSSLHPNVNEIKEETDKDTFEAAPERESPIKEEFDGSDSKQCVKKGRRGQKRSLSESDAEDDTESTDSGKEEKPAFVHNPVSKDVIEGKSLFLRNVSVDANEEQIEELFSRFGEVKRVVFCRDKITNWFRGTAFVQYLAKEGADACLEAHIDPLIKSQFKVCDRFLNVSRTVGRGDLEKKTKPKKELEDKRNVFLAKEGVVRGGTKGAKGVSKVDLALRVEREFVKRKMLANLSTFISPVRLFVCNIPLHTTDKELRDIIKKHAAKSAEITECRIMKNIFETDDSGKPTSKGHGFVTFTQHRHALDALRNINNNPDVFTKQQRPVVEFSMENMNVLKAKANRLKKSRDGNVIRKVPDLENKNVDNSAEFMGSNYDPKKRGMKALHTHIGPKVRHRNEVDERTGKKKFTKDQGPKKGKKKITRNQVNNQMRNSKINKKKKEVRAQKIAKEKKKRIKERKNKTKGGDSKKKQKSKKRKFI